MATRNRGLIINPSSSVLKIDAYPEANFAGMCGYEHREDPSCVKSRTGYVINVANCPVMWQYKLQTKRCFQPWRQRSWQSHIVLVS
jgi:hypothetical protein